MSHLPDRTSVESNEQGATVDSKDQQIVLRVLDQRVLTTPGVLEAFIASELHVPSTIEDVEVARAALEQRLRAVQAMADADLLHRLETATPPFSIDLDLIGSEISRRRI